MNDQTLQAINTKLNSDFKLIKQFVSGIANLNYLLENSDGTKIVARIIKEQKPENLHFEYLVQTELKIAGIGSPQIFLEKGKPLVLKVGNQKITFSNFIQSDPHPEQFSKQLLKNLGEILAKFQKALKDIPPDQVPENYLSESYQNKLKFSKQKEEVALEIKTYIKNLYQRITKLNLPKAIIHGDLNNGNILTKGDQIIAILDLETVEYKERILDPAILIYYRQPDSNLSYPKVSELILAGFEKVTKLNPAEKEALPLAIQYTGACFSLWSLANEEVQDRKEFLKSFYALQNRIETGFAS
jgi:Ser/Thr protein kinase RdoA (MazF antagonist)